MEVHLDELADISMAYQARPTQRAVNCSKSAQLVRAARTRRLRIALQADYGHIGERPSDAMRRA